MMKLLSLLALLAFTSAVTQGSAEIPFLTVWKIALNRTLDSELFPVLWNRGSEIIVWNIRFPRVLMAFISGAVLSLTGILMQSVTKNPLADPYILGISSGASTGAVLCMFFGFGGLSVGGGAFTGALIASLLVITLSRGDFSSGRLVLTGIAVSAVFSSMTNILIYLVKDESKVRNAVFWMAGSLGGAQWSSILLPSLTLLAGCITAVVLSKELDMLLLGGEEAGILGVDTEKLKFFLIALCSLLTGIIVSQTGTIGFVGMIIPHISRRIAGSGHKVLIPQALLIGGTFMVGADTISRTIFAPEELPIGILTSFLGGPFFLWIIKSGYNFGGKRC